VTEVAAAGANLHLVHDAAEIPSDRPALVLNWGGNNQLPGHLVVLNQPEAVRVSSDQVESLRRLGDLAPRTVLNPEDAILLGSERVVAKRRQGARGSNKRVLPADSPAGELAGFDLYQEFLPRRREYRVSVLSGQVVSAYRKLPAPETEAENLRPRWRFEPLQHLPRPVVEIARRGTERIGLDYAGVDVVEDLDSGRVLCLEANAAPGMSADTLRSLYNTVQQVLRGSQG
jgi:glutathione synthase/RimK-type ligase-like ATP-grasp enzyme